MAKEIIRQQLISARERSELLPKTVQQIADVIGREAALTLVQRLPRSYAGRRRSGIPMLYVPKTLSPDHSLVQMIGCQAAQKLVRAFGGEILYPAACTELDRIKRYRGMHRMLAEGASLEAVAQAYGVTVRHVRNVRRMEIPSEETRAIHPHDASCSISVSG